LATPLSTGKESVSDCLRPEEEEQQTHLPIVDSFAPLLLDKSRLGQSCDAQGGFIQLNVEALA
jgi:hypothetical protein